MKHFLTYDREQAKVQILDLVKKYQENSASFEDNSYKEAELRTDFINPFLRSLGWDVGNQEGKSQLYRTVIEEETINVEEGNQIRKKNPDYTLQVLGKRELFVEVKKAFLNLDNLSSAAFQTRRYGWSAKLGISILTNFRQLVIYDCRHQPSIEDPSHVARYRIYSLEDYENTFDEIYNLISFEQVSNGVIDSLFSYESHQGIPFDRFFLNQINSWRLDLASNIIKKQALDHDSLNLLVQRLINRIVFLRICEDREIEIHEQLKKITSYQELKALFQTSDRKYNSGLFDFIEDELTLNIDLDNDIIVSIFESLYYPLSPYDFSVVDSKILSQIYEEFLGSKLTITESKVDLEIEPEVAASSGVVPTPIIIVDRIIEETIAPLVQGKNATELDELKIVDICCGSGVFLVQLFDYLVNIHEQLTEERLPFSKRVEILIHNIYGIDINPYAGEVTRFSLLLKLLEGESVTTLKTYIDENPHAQRFLPNLNNNIKTGNSLVGANYYDYDEAAILDFTLQSKIRPFEFYDAFPFLEEKGGFDAVIGNPPYVRIQNLKKYSREEVDFYRAKNFKYSVASKENFDKYFLFIEQGIKLLNEQGRLGYIVPNKFFVIKSGIILRDYISEHASLSRVIHFGVNQVFPGRSTYTAILVLTKTKQDSFSFDRVSNITPAGLVTPEFRITYQNEDFKDNAWVFLSKEASAVIEKIKNADVIPLGNIVDIAVGLQTSKDPIYIIKKFSMDERFVHFQQGENNWKIERDITRPCLYKASFSLFDTPEANALMIYPYSLSGREARVYSEQEMKNSFPLCYDYFRYHKAVLEKRKISGGKKEDRIWYQYGRSQSLEKYIDQNKLIWSVLAKSSPYAFDTSGSLFTSGGNGPYYGLLQTSQYSLLYILGVLSLPSVEAMVKSRTSEFRGEYYSHGKQFMEHLPIPKINFESEESRNKHDAIVTQVEKLIDINSRRKAQKIGSRNTTERAYNYVLANLYSDIRSLYGITEDDEKTLVNKLFIA